MKTGVDCDTALRKEVECDIDDDDDEEEDRSLF